MFSASTYADTIGLTFTSDRHMMPDPEFMRQCLDETVNELRRYLESKAGARKPKRAARRKAKKSLAA